MAENADHRKLTAILCADVKGYSKLMGEDESYTVGTLKECRKLFAENIQIHGGRVVNAPGDSILAEFPSVVSAVHCAVEIQNQLNDRNTALPDDRKMAFRIGVNLGDVIQSEDAIYGDGVNIAARIEALAEPGGVSISRTVIDHVQKKLPYGYEYQGEHQVKNITNPVKVYKLLTAPEDAGKLVGMEPTVSASKWIWPTVVIATVVVTLIGYQVYQELAGPTFEPASVDKMVFALPEKPSIAVLPFDNMGEEKEHEYLADGFTETIIASLAQSPELFVIARNSVFTYKGKPTKVQKVAEELGVQYVLEGSIQHADNRVRITAQLIDALNGRHLWADQYDRNIQDLFIVQDEISRNVFVEMHVALGKGEHERVASRGTQNLDALLLRMKGLAEGRKFTKEGQLKARELYGKATEADPGYARAWAGISWSYWYEAMMGGWTLTRDEALRKAIAYAEQAIEVDPFDPSGYQFLCDCMSLKGEHDRAIALCKKAVELAPNDFQAHGHLGTTLMWAEEPEQGLEYLERAKRLSPRYPAWVDMVTGFAQLMDGRNEEAIVSLQRSVDRSPKTTLTRGRLVAALVAAGQLVEAKKEAAELLKIMPNFTVNKYVKIHRFKDPTRFEWLSGLLLQAGLPEYPPIPLPDKPSIAVLPFDNLSNDHEQEYFCDGFTEDIITALSRIPKMLVIARNSTFTYKGKPLNIQQIGSDLGVHYVLEGSIRKVDETLRVNAQLIDAKTGHHLWAEKYDREMKAIFALQDDLTKNIISAMQVELTEGEQARVDAKGTNNLEAYLKFLQARENILKLNAEGNALGKKMAQEAIDLDPKFSMAYRVLAAGYRMDIFLGTSKSPKQSIGTCIKLLKKSTELDETYAEAYGALGFTYGLIGKHDEAITIAEKAISLDPNSANTYLMLGHTFRMADRPEDAIMAYTKAVRLNPLPPSIYFSGLGMSYSLAGLNEEAIKWCEKAVQQEPDSYIDRIFMIAVYSMAGRVEDARSEVPDLLRINPNFSLAAVEKRAKYKYKDKMIKALRKANLPE